MKKPIFKWDEESGFTTCELFDEDNIGYTGFAMCHPEDQDMKSRLTGEQIAHLRAAMKMTKGQIRKIKNKLAGLNQLYYSMNKSKRYNPESYEAQMLQRQIHICHEDIKNLKKVYTLTSLDLTAYITAKDHFYKVTRRNRKEQELIEK